MRRAPKRPSCDGASASAIACRQGRAAAGAGNGQGHRGNPGAGRRHADRNTQAGPNAEVFPDELLARLSMVGDVCEPRRARLRGETAAAAAAGTPPRTGAAPAGTGRCAVAARARGAAAVARAFHRRCRRRRQRSSMGRVTAQDVERHVGVHRSRLPDARFAHSAQRRFGGAWPNTWRAASARRRTSPRCSKRILTRVLAHRARYAAHTESRGAHLTLTAYFVSACATALHAHREVNATFQRRCAGASRGYQHRRGHRARR